MGGDACLGALLLARLGRAIAYVLLWLVEKNLGRVLDCALGPVCAPVWGLRRKGGHGIRSVQVRAPARRARLSEVFRRILGRAPAGRDLTGWDGSGCVVSAGFARGLAH